MSNKFIVEQAKINPNKIPISNTFTKNLVNSGGTLTECLEYIDQTFNSNQKYFEGMLLLKAFRFIDEPISGARVCTKNINTIRIVISCAFPGSIATSTGLITTIFNNNTSTIYKRNAFSQWSSFGTGSALSYDVTGAVTGNNLVLGDNTGTAIVGNSGIYSETFFNLRPNTQRIGYSYISANRTTTQGLASHQWHQYADNITPIDNISMVCLRNVTGTILIYGC